MANAIAVHPAAAVWPQLPTDELKALADDIAANGLIDPISLDNDGQLVDGRNRLAACELAGVKPVFVTITAVDDAEIAAFIVSRNSARRHMTPSAVAMATAKTLALSGQRANGRWKYRSIESGKSSTSSEKKSMSKAGTVIDHAPDLADAVVNGATSLDAAHTEAQRRKQAAESAEAKMADLSAREPDLAARVKDETLTLAEALAAADQRERERQQAIAAGERAASGFRLSVLGDVATVATAISMGAAIDTAPLIAVLEQALDALRNGASYV